MNVQYRGEVVGIVTQNTDAREITVLVMDEKTEGAPFQFECEFSSEEFDREFLPKFGQKVRVTLEWDQTGL